MEYHSWKIGKDGFRQIIVLLERLCGNIKIVRLICRKNFMFLDMSRFHYVVVAGRRTDFRDKTYIIKRERKKADDIDIIHYDNLFDFSNNLIGKQTY